jgi:Ser/Thr protein kinase RdoA (MazF antagonist)
VTARPPDGARRLPSGPHSCVYAVDGPCGAVVVKLSDPALTAREAAALRAVRHLDASPAVLAEGEGVLVLSLLPGRTLPPDRLDAARAARLGAVIRRLHESQVSGTGGWPDWSGEAHDLPAYHRRAAATVREWAPAAHRALADAVLAGLPALPPAPEPGFRRLHGDLWSGNLLWDGDELGLVDWEYSRQGDPAEELAYVIEMDGLTPAVAAALLHGYGLAGMAPRVAAWRPLAALGAGLWYADLGLEEQAATLLRRAAAAG